MGAVMRRDTLLLRCQLDGEAQASITLVFHSGFDSWWNQEFIAPTTVVIPYK